MKTLESPTTTPFNPTAARAQVNLSTSVTGRPTPRPDKGNLWIEIKIDPRTGNATCDCQAEEHVGRHKKREVTFRADQDCGVNFSNEKMFGMSKIVLDANVETTLNVDDKFVGDTSFEIFADLTRATTSGAMGMPTPHPLRPPIIIVP